jgi:hypothetical protein
MPDPIILEGPDGRLYEVPRDVLAKYAVPGERVAELRKKLGAPATPGALPPNHFRPGDPLPPGVPPPPSPGASMTVSSPSASTTIATPNGGTVVLNFFFGPPAEHAEAAAGMSPSPHAGIEGYHMSFDANGIPTNHVDLLWGDYIDKQGNPAVGWHSHDPVTGNAQ